MFSTILYNLFVGPLELLFNVVFNCVGKVVPGIFAVSIIMNFLTLPLYKRADAIQAAERDKVASMQHWIDHIKRTFKGDERYMMITRYYAQEHYRPIYALRSTFPLLLQIPFFMAAFNFLSGEKKLLGVSFLFLKDLGRPDALFMIGNFSVNIMPILMTVLNFVSSYIYLRGMPLKSKIQTYGIAVIFLVLLYDRPSGLVLYWTLNQIFSILKNVFMKLVRKQRTRNLFFAAAGLFVMVFGIRKVSFMAHPERFLALMIVGLIFMLPLFVSLFKRNHHVVREVRSIGTVYFILGAVCLCLFMGFMIPSEVVASAPEEFYDGFVSPSGILSFDLSLYIGVFIVWLGVFYFISDARMRNVFTVGVWVLVFVSLLNYFVFSKDYGTMSSMLIFDDENKLRSGRREALINLLACAAAIALALLIAIRRKKVLPYISAILIPAILCLSVVNCVKIGNAVSNIDALKEKQNEGDAQQAVFTFSKTGHNVVVLMLDRAINGFIPYIMNEKPELRESFDGFTYYPNTLSHGSMTKAGTPTLFGGYEYTPTEWAKRTDMTNVEKQNEALKVMPVLFNQNGYDVFVADPPLAGYKNYSDLSIYDEYPEIRTKNFNETPSSERLEQANVLPEVITKVTYNRFFMYSIFRIAPSFLRKTIYGARNFPYLLSQGSKIKQTFLKWYLALDDYPEMTAITDDGSDHFMMMNNAAPHENMLLKLPEYVPDENAVIQDDDMSRFSLDGESILMDTETRLSHYHVNMATLLKVGEWFDMLREQGVWDNTRIIIVADHGRGLALSDKYVLDGYDICKNNPLLMVKDFNSHGFTTCNDFMTNADVPTLATEGLIVDPVNPFTGKAITNEAKEGVQLIPDYSYWDTNDGDMTNFYGIEDVQWWSVHDDIFVHENWEKTATP